MGKPTNAQLRGVQLISFFHYTNMFWSLLWQDVTEWEYKQYVSDYTAREKSFKPFR
jgi:hypothetical protein